MGPTLQQKLCPARAVTAFASALLPTPVPPLEGAVSPGPAVPYASTFPSLQLSSLWGPEASGRTLLPAGYTCSNYQPRFVTLPHRRSSSLLGLGPDSQVSYDHSFPVFDFGNLEQCHEHFLQVFLEQTYIQLLGNLYTWEKVPGPFRDVKYLKQVD